MRGKLLSSLKKSDLLNHLVWEHWYENSVEYVRSTDSRDISESSNIGYIVRTNVTLNNWANMTGFCSS